MASAGRRRPMPAVPGVNKPLPPPPSLENTPPPPLPSRPGRAPPVQEPTDAYDEFQGTVTGFQEPLDCYDEFQGIANNDQGPSENYDDFQGTLQGPSENYDDFQGTVQEPTDNYDEFQGTVEIKKYHDEPSETYEAVGEDQSWKSDTQSHPPALPPFRPKTKTDIPPPLPSLVNRPPIPNEPTDNYDDFQGTVESKQFHDEPSETYEAVGEEHQQAWKNQKQQAEPPPPALPPSRPNARSGVAPPPVPSLVNRPPIRKPTTAPPPSSLQIEPSEVYEELGMNGIDGPEETYEEAAEIPPPIPSSRSKTGLPPLPSPTGRPPIKKVPPPPSSLEQETYEGVNDEPTDIYEDSFDGPEEEYDEPVANKTTRSVPPPPVLPSKSNNPPFASRSTRPEPPKKVSAEASKFQPAIGLSQLQGVKLKSVGQKETPKKVEEQQSAINECEEANSVRDRIKKMQQKFSGNNAQSSPKRTSIPSFSSVSSTSSNKSLSEDRPALPARPSDSDRPPLPSRPSEGSNSSQDLHISPKSKAKVHPPLPSPKVEIPVFAEPEDIYDDGLSAPVIPKDPLDVFPWYHGPIERNDGNTRLNAVGKDGAYLIRKSKAGGEKQPYTLMVLFKSRVNNLKIRLTDTAKFALGDPKPDELTFKDIEAIVNHHKTCEVILFSGSGGKTMLLHPAKKV